MTNQLPRMAVCLAVYNGRQWVEEQIETILGQKGIDVTVFISVDLSSDNSEGMIDQIALSDSRLKVLEHGCRFGGAALNFFRILREVDFLGFDYVAFADQDDIWKLDKLRYAHEKLQATGADAYSSNVMAFWPDGRKSLIEKSQKQVEWDFLFEAAGPGCTYVVKKELAFAFQALLRSRRVNIQQIGLHDWFLYAFARAHDFRWVIDDYVGMFYRQHEKNQVGVNIGWRASLHRARKILGGWGLSQSALIAELVGLGNDPFVQRWSKGSRMGLLTLSFHAWQCRRRLRDKILFAFSCIALLLSGGRRS
jgi:rhamnosyltransferase